MPTFHSVRIRTCLALLFSALIFVSIGFGVFSGARRSICDAARVAHTHQALRSIDEVQASLLLAETAARGY
ncbi:hypothetical protein [Xanthomonas cerealis]|uniref:hypothetical protein n=1 Tax=Xanthomonas cerealis TaxID=3390025 RepID=UPI0039648281